MPTPNLFKAQAQANKAAALVFAIDRTGLEGEIDPHREAAAVCEVLLRWNALHWRICAVANGIRPPSEETQAIVLEVFANRALSRVRAG